VHALRNLLDACTFSRPVDSLALVNKFLAAGVRAELSSVSGGFVVDTDPCDAFTFHGYLGIEPTAVLPVTTWLDARMSELAGNTRPQAAFAELPGAANVTDRFVYVVTDGVSAAVITIRIGG